MFTCSRSTITGVLLLWLCVIAASVCAPVARAHITAQSMERLCSGHGVVQWQPSPVAEQLHGDGAELHHRVDCPLCLPVLAPPPVAETLAVPPMPVYPVSVTGASFIPAYFAHWPPPRGPPASF